MGTHAQPEITSPVSRQQTASTGVVQNIGTSLGSTAAGTTSGGVGGFTNNSIGGTAFNGIQPANQIPTRINSGVNTMAVVKNPLEGGAVGRRNNVYSSTNPLSIQNDVTADVPTNTVAQTDGSTVHVTLGGNPPISPTQTAANPDNGALPKSYAVELPANGVNFPKDVPPAATIAAPTQISYKGDWASPVTGNPGHGNVLNNIAVATADANGPTDNFIDGAATFNHQAKPTSGNPTLPADGGPTSSIQVRSTNSEGLPNNSIPFDNGTTDKP